MFSDRHSLVSYLAVSSILCNKYIRTSVFYWKPWFLVCLFYKMSFQSQNQAISLAMKFNKILETHLCPYHQLIQDFHGDQSLKFCSKTSHCSQIHQIRIHQFKIKKSADLSKDFFQILFFFSESPNFTRLQRFPTKKWCAYISTTQCRYVL